MLTTQIGKFMLDRLKNCATRVLDFSNNKECKNQERILGRVSYDVTNREKEGFTP